MLEEEMMEEEADALDLVTTAALEENRLTVEAATVGRAEIDTSAPFLSVREAVDRFGGIAVWKSQLRELFHPEKLNCPEDLNEAISVEEQAAQLEMDLILKEKETLHVLQELEMAKKIVDALKLRLQEEVPEATKMPVGNSDDMMIQLVPGTEEHCPCHLEEDVGMDDPDVGANQSQENLTMIASDFEKDIGIDDSSIPTNQSPRRRIPVELKEVKENLTKTTSSLADIQTSIRVLNMKIQEEKLLLDKSQVEQTANAALISSLEEDLDQTATELQRAKDLESENCEDSLNILQEIKQFNSEIELSKKANEALELASESENCEDSSNILQEIKQFNSEIELSKKTNEASKTEASELASESENCEDSSNILQEIKQFNSEIELSKKTNEASKTEASELASESENCEDSSNILQEIKQFNSEIELSKKTNEASETEASELASESENCEDSSNILQEIKQFNSEIELSKKTNEASKTEASELASEIEHTKASIKTVELRWLAARKMEEAAKAAEAMALADIKALICSNKAILDLQNTCGVTLSMEEYMALASKAQEADQNSRKKLEIVMLQVDQASMSKAELMTKVEEAMTKAKKCKKALEDALKRAEVANRAKLEVEDALRKWRSEHGQQSHSVHNSTKFKKDFMMLDPKSSSSSGPLSIGQILSMKLAGPESLEQHEIASWEKENEKPTVSLGQMLNKRHGVCLMSQRLDENRDLSIKRTKLGFVGLPHLLVKQGKKNMKKRHSSSIE